MPENVHRSGVTHKNQYSERNKGQTKFTARYETKI